MLRRVLYTHKGTNELIGNNWKIYGHVLTMGMIFACFLLYKVIHLSILCR